ncbi:hypothetical protein SLS56_010462 [Neofusicoccum ribis]|uniref:Uncharacterized protein n=1 Tax=Neofusicoccum ribis TaxID=45134 RepID=A0ABR3SEC6_9PEZI
MPLLEIAMLEMPLLEIALLGMPLLGMLLLEIALLEIALLGMALLGMALLGILLLWIPLLEIPLLGMTLLGITLLRKLLLRKLLLGKLLLGKLLPGILLLGRALVEIPLSTESTEETALLERAVSADDRVAGLDDNAERALATLDGRLVATVCTLLKIWLEEMEGTSDCWLETVLLGAREMPEEDVTLPTNAPAWVLSKLGREETPLLDDSSLEVDKALVLEDTVEIDKAEDTARLCDDESAALEDGARDVNDGDALLGTPKVEDAGVGRRTVDVNPDDERTLEVKERGAVEEPDDAESTVALEDKTAVPLVGKLVETNRILHPGLRGLAATCRGRI